MMLDKIIRGRVERPPRVVVYGPPGVGKTTFAAGWPKPICIQTEDGGDDVGLDRFPLAKTWAAAMDALRSLATEGHDYQTVVVDSADWLETLAADSIAKAHGTESISDPSVKAFSYGKGYELVNESMRIFLEGLDWLRDNKDMAVVITAHSEVKRFDDPLGDSYDRYQPRLHKLNVGTLVEWSDALLFAGYETFTRTAGESFGKERTVGVGSGRRVLHTEERPGHIAKNRYSLPAQIDLTYQAFDEARRAASAKKAKE